MNPNRRKLFIVTGAAIVADAFSISAHAADKLKIGIIGSGKVGSALGAVWVKAGHEVMFSSSPFLMVRCLMWARTWRNRSKAR